MSSNDIITRCDKLRAEIGRLDEEVDSMAIEISNGEGVANIKLAHRHLEDARMRMGKVIQALEGGISILDHPKVKALIAQIRADA